MKSMHRHRFLSPAPSSILRLFLLAALATGPSALLLTLPSPAFAQSDEDLARERFMEGRQLFQDGEFHEAAEKFREAYELSGRSALLYNIGQAYRRADNLRDAERYFQQYLAEQPDAANADEVVETIIEIQREQASRLAILRVETTPSGAQIFIDDDSEPRCESPCSLDLDPGTYELRAQAQGFLPTTSSVTLGIREELNTALALRPSQRTGKLHIRANVSGASLTANNRTFSVPTTEPVELPEGAQTITVQYRSSTWTETIEIRSGETLHVFAPIGSMGSGDFSPLQLSAIGLGGASLGLATAAALMGRQAQSTHDHLSRQQALSGEVDPNLVDTGKSQRFLTNTLWISSFLTLGAGAGLWTWDLLRSSSQPAELEPTEDDTFDLL